MSVAKVAITLDREVLTTVDRLVRQHLYPSRSRVIQQAVEEKIAKLESNRLARECAKLDPEFEKAMAEDGLSSEVESWPEY